MTSEIINSETASNNEIFENTDNGDTEIGDNIDNNKISNPIEFFNDNELNTKISVSPPIPIGQRWDPLGAAANDDEDIINDFNDKSIDCNFNEKSIINKTNLLTVFNNELSFNDNLDNYINFSDEPSIDTYRIKSLEEEQEILTSSLMALTSHFAQVQFRLRQIVEAPTDERDQLLKNLEEFAFRGIPEISGNSNSDDDQASLSQKQLTETAKERQFELIDQLKKQLSDLEKYAYESGAPVLPQSIVLEKQKIIIDELKSKLNLNVSDADLPQLTSEDLRNQVDLAIGEIIGPIKMKEQLVTQLKTQITDLERFIAFLQCESEDTRLKALEIDFTSNLTSLKQNNGIQLNNFHNIYKNDNINDCMDDNDDIIDKKFELLAYNSYAAKKKAAEKSRSRNQLQYDASSNLYSTKRNDEIKNVLKKSNIESNQTMKTEENDKNYENNSKEHKLPIKCENTTGINNGTLNEKAHNLLDKAAAVLNMFVLSQFGCSSENRSDYFHTNSLKRTQTGNHWGDIRAKLEIDIQEVLRLLFAAKLEGNCLKGSKHDETTDEQTNKIYPKNHKNNFKNEANSIPITKEYKKSSYDKNIISMEKINQRQNSYQSSVDDDDGRNNHTESIRNDNSNKRYSLSSIELTAAIRRNFAVTLQKLIQHGLKIPQKSSNNSIVPFMNCFNLDPTNDINSDYNNFYLNEHSNYSNSKLINKRHNLNKLKNYDYLTDDDDDRDDNNGDDDDDDDDDNDDENDINDVFHKNINLKSRRSKFALNMETTSEYVYDTNNKSTTSQMHAWELILEYYNIKNGERFNDAPIRKLSQSFNLDISGSRNLSNKQSLLIAIGNIITMHEPYKTSYNSHFKAFICSALNCHKLVQWLSLILQCTELIENNYYTWSYVTRTGFRDALRSIDVLTKHDFDLPVNLAVRQFENIKDVFM